jgi:hypothetical protein
MKGWSDITIDDAGKYNDNKLQKQSSIDICCSPAIVIRTDNQMISLVTQGR